MSCDRRYHRDRLAVPPAAARRLTATAGTAVNVARARKGTRLLAPCVLLFARSSELAAQRTSRLRGQIPVGAGDVVISRLRRRQRGEPAPPSAGVGYDVAAVVSGNDPPSTPPADGDPASSRRLPRRGVAPSEDGALRGSSGRSEARLPLVQSDVRAHLQHLLPLLQGTPPAAATLGLWRALGDAVARGSWCLRGQHLVFHNERGAGGRGGGGRSSAAARPAPVARLPPRGGCGRSPGRDLHPCSRYAIPGILRALAHSRARGAHHRHLTPARASSPPRARVDPASPRAPVGLRWAPACRQSIRTPPSVRLQASASRDPLSRGKLLSSPVRRRFRRLPAPARPGTFRAEATESAGKPHPPDFRTLAPSHSRTRCRGSTR